MTAKLKRNYYLCPVCKQDMRANPHRGLNGKDCPQCGQGIRWREEANRRAALSYRQRTERAPAGHEKAEKAGEKGEGK